MLSLHTKSNYNIKALRTQLHMMQLEMYDSLSQTDGCQEVTAWLLNTYFKIIDKTQIDVCFTILYTVYVGLTGSLCAAIYALRASVTLIFKMVLPPSYSNSASCDMYSLEAGSSYCIIILLMFIQTKYGIHDVFKRLWLVYFWC